MQDAATWACKGPCRLPEKFRGLYWLDGNVIGGSLSPFVLLDLTYADWNPDTRTLALDSRQPGTWVSMQWTKLNGKLTTPGKLPDDSVTRTHNGYAIHFDEMLQKGVMDQTVMSFTQPRCWYYMDLLDREGDGRELRRRSYYPVLPNCAGPEFRGLVGTMKRAAHLLVGLVLGHKMCPIPPLNEPYDFGDEAVQERPELYEYYSARRLVHNGKIDEENMDAFLQTFDPDRRKLDDLHPAHKKVEWGGTVARIAVKKID